MSDAITTAVEIVEVQPLDAATVQRVERQLCALLQDAVDGGASLGFWPPLDDEQAQRYWRAVFAGVDAGERHLLVAQQAGVVVGSVQLELALKQNGAHRAEVQKLMVHRASRRHGVGHLLMKAIESQARTAGRTLLILDTQSGSDAERLYLALGYQRVGGIPGYTVEADGSVRATTLFYKALASKPSRSESAEAAELSAPPQTHTGEEYL